MNPIPYTFNDGGRQAAGFTGNTGDCVARAICIAANHPYREVCAFLAQGNATERQTKRAHKRSGRRSAFQGIQTRRKWFSDYMASLGFRWVATMFVGSGCKVHLRADELPPGRLVVNVSRHLCAVINGVLMDTHDCSRDGTRCVYGYWILDENK